MDSFISLYMERNISEISVRQVCDNIHLSRTSFYHYFDNLNNVLDTIKQELIDQLSFYNQDFYKLDLSTLGEELYDQLAPVLVYIKDNSQYIKALLRHRDSDDFYTLWAGIIQRDFKKKYQFSDRETRHMDITLELTSAAIIGLYEYWLYHLNTISENDIIFAIYNQLCTAFQ